MTKDKLIRKLGDALINAEAHLEYCGYGDSWERECSEALQEELPKAIEVYEEYKRDNK